MPLIELKLITKYIVFPLIVGLISCTSLQKREKQMVTSYLRNSCDEYKALAKNKEFPLQDVALLKSYKVCKKIDDLPPIDSVDVPNNPWIKDLYLDAQIRIQDVKKNYKELALFSIEKALITDADRTKLEILTQVKEKYFSALSEMEQQNLMTAIYNVAPSLMPSPQAKDWLKVASDYRKKRDFKQAESLYRKIIQNNSLPLEDRMLSYQGLAQNYKLQGRRAEHIDTLYRYSRWLQKYYVKTKETKLLGQWLDTEILYTRALWTDNQVSTAYARAKVSLLKLKKKINVADFYVLLARMHEEKNEFDESIRLYQLAAKEPQNTPLQLSRIYWGLAWDLRKSKKYEESIQSYLKLIEITTNPPEKYKYQFWLAQTYIDNNQKDLAAPILTNLKNEDLSGYYGVLAYLTSQESLPPIYDRKLASETPVSKIQDPHIKKFDWLIQVKEYELGKRYVDFLTQKLKKDKQLGSREWLDILKKYAQSGLYLPLFSNFNQLDMNLKNQIIKLEPELLFPKRFDEVIIESSEKAKIPSELAFSIIRQESAFNPEARSPADAFGLMQVLPTVAYNISQKYKLPYGTHNDLFKPEINIPIGCELLRGLLQKNDGNYILAIASYNAAEDAVRGWLKTRYTGNTLEFIEDVPYEETKAYIKLVLRNMVFYQRLMEPEKPHSIQSEWFELKI